VVVSLELARRFWPGQDPLGKTLRNAAGDLLEVVGLAPDTAVHNLGGIDKPTYYRMWDPNSALYVPLVRFHGDGPAMARAVRAALQRVLPDAAVDAQVTQSLLDHAVSPFRSVAALMSVFGVIALLLALIGIYGVVAFAVRQRTREVGIRIALGAQKSDIFHAVLVPGLRPIGVGLLLGLALALASSRMLSALLRSSELHINTADPVAYAAVCLILTASAVAAMIGPALRAAACNPIDVLREE
jgi:predicted lysophospholipase L1 biosynthesis ABC-type transport system permease subunit